MNDLKQEIFRSVEATPKSFAPWLGDLAFLPTNRTTLKLAEAHAGSLVLSSMLYFVPLMLCTSGFCPELPIIF